MSAQRERPSYPTKLEPATAGITQGGGRTLVLAGTRAADGLAWLQRRRAVRPLLSGRAYAWSKRGTDIGLIALFSPMLAALFGLCWVAVKLEAPRAPALFRQQRTGRRGRRFLMHKFRTMVPDAEARKAEVAALNKLRWPDFKIEHDPRITPVGRVLRRTSLDELPQLLNILKGEMSLVGPRPTSFAADTYDEWQKARLEAVPGLTGLWQVVGRGAMEFDDRVRLDLEYIERQSLTLDWQILLRTVGAVFSGRGAL